MNVACPACPAKYAVPDEKVRGKKARITCKRCGSAIIIDGTALNQASKAPAPAKAKLEPLPPPPEMMTQNAGADAAAEETADEWLVAITDDQQEPASVERIVGLYASGVIDADTFLWKEGMAEWQTAFEIPEIAAALAARGLSHRVIEHGVENMGSSIPTYDDDEATHIGRPSAALAAQVTAAASGWTEPGRWGGNQGAQQPYDDELTISRDSAPLASPYPFKSDDSQDDDATISREPSSPFGSPLPAAGRSPDSSRSLPRTTRSSNPGGEASPSSRRRYVRPAPASERPPPAAAVAAAAAARRAAASPASERRPERARVADLFGAQAGAGAEDDPNLGRADSVPPDSGGARLTGQRNESSVLFSLDALIKAENEPEPARAPRPDLRAQRETELLLGGGGPSSIANLGGDFNALVAPDLMAPARAMPEPLPSRATYDDDFAPPRKSGRWFKVLLLIVLAGGIGAAIAVLGPKYLNPPKAPLVTANIPAEKAPPKAAETTPPAADVPPADSAGAAPPPTGVAAAPKPEAPSAPRGASEPRGASKPVEPAPEKEKTLADAMGEGTTAPFDAASAKSALVTAANGAASCKQEGGPTGTGRALVTFAPSGRVTKAEITGDFAGTGVGGCVARLFRAARVPKFAGDPTTVSKNFTID